MLLLMETFFFLVSLDFQKIHELRFIFIYALIHADKTKSETYSSNDFVTTILSWDPSNENLIGFKPAYYVMFCSRI